jgi:hypothetical protein
MGGEWEDKYLSLREENERLKELQREQANREHKIAARIVALKEQQTALSEGRVVPGDSTKEAKLAELQQTLRTLDQQGQLLATRLQSHKNVGARPATAGASPTSRKAANPKGAAGPGADKGTADGGNALKKIADLKKEILETNLAWTKLQEQKASQDMHHSLSQPAAGQHGHVGDAKDKEELKRKFKTKEAEFTIAKDQLDKVTKECDEQASRAEAANNEVKKVQNDILEQQRQHRALEAEIKKLKLQRDKVRYGVKDRTHSLGQIFKA